MLYFKFHSIVRANFCFRYFAHPPQKFNEPLFLLILFMNMERFGPDQAPEWPSFHDQYFVWALDCCRLPDTRGSNIDWVWEEY